MQTYFGKLKTYVDENPPCFGDGESILTLLFEAYNEVDDPPIKADFNELYYLMNGWVFLFGMRIQSGRQQCRPHNFYPITFSTFSMSGMLEIPPGFWVLRPAAAQAKVTISRS